MKSPNTTLWVIFLISILSAISCKRNGECPDKLMSQRYKDYFFPGKVGSYWVYQDSITNDIDTITIVGEEYTLKANDGDSKCREESILQFIIGFIGSSDTTHTFGTWNMQYVTLSNSSFCYDDNSSFPTKNIVINDSTYSDCITVYKCSPSQPILYATYSPNVGCVSMVGNVSGQDFVYKLMSYVIII